MGKQLYKDLERILGSEIVVVIDRDVPTFGRDPNPVPNYKIRVYDAAGVELGNVLDNYQSNFATLPVVREVFKTYAPAELLTEEYCPPSSMPQRNSVCTGTPAFIVPESVTCSEGCERDAQGNAASVKGMAKPGFPPVDVTLCKETCIKAHNFCTGFTVDPNDGTCSFFSDTPTEDFTKDENDTPLGYCYVKDGVLN